MNGIARNKNVIPSTEESKKFWSEIWSKGKQHNSGANWLRKLKKDRGNQQQET